MTPDGEETSALLRRLPGVRAFDLELAAAELLTPAMRRLRFVADGLGELDAFAGQDLMFAVPAPGRSSFRRRYTIRHLDKKESAVEIDIVLHGDGPGAAWAAEVCPGDHVEALGPRGKIPLAAHAGWHLFCGDESSLPAIFTMVESLPDGTSAQVVLEVTGTEDHQEPQDVRAALELQWVYRAGEPGAGTALQDAVAELSLDGIERGHDSAQGPGHAYVFGELRQVSACRSVLLDHGLAPDQIDHKAYWRCGVANAAHGEPERPPSS